MKHRFGTTGEVGLFEMGEAGLRGVPDASGLLLSDRRAGAPGSVVVPAIEGRRPMLVEIQALVINRNNVPQPRRNAQGLDAGRVSLLAAVLDRHANYKVAGSDVYASAVGGVRVTEPAADLGIAIALASSISNRPVAHDVVACGEIGLSGEVRQVSQMPRRLAEAVRLGFRTAIVPSSTGDGPDGLYLVRVATVAEAIRCACAPPSSTSSPAPASA
jgi:DNA repair protein RadA/Sms